MHKSCTSDHCEGASSKSTFAGKLFSDFIFSPSLSLSLSICSSFTFCHSLRLLSVAIDGWIIFPFNSIMSVHRHIAHICRRLIQFIGSAGWMCTMHMISDKIKYYLMDFMVGNIEMIECNFRLISAWMFVSKKVYESSRRHLEYVHVHISLSLSLENCKTAARPHNNSFIYFRCCRLEISHQINEHHVQCSRSLHAQFIDVVRRFHTDANIFWRNQVQSISFFRGGCLHFVRWCEGKNVQNQKMKSLPNNSAINRWHENPVIPFSLKSAETSRHKQ